MIKDEKYHCDCRKLKTLAVFISKSGSLFWLSLLCCGCIGVLSLLRKFLSFLMHGLLSLYTEQLTIPECCWLSLSPKTTLQSVLTKCWRSH